MVTSMARRISKQANILSNGSQTDNMPIFPLGTPGTTLANIPNFGTKTDIR